jgi:hypothetical protein
VASAGADRGEPLASRRDAGRCGTRLRDDKLPGEPMTSIIENRDAAGLPGMMVPADGMDELRSWVERRARA